MKKKLFYLLTAVLLLLIQTHPFLPFGKDGIRPDLFFALAVYVGIRCSAINGALICFFLGCFLEIFSGANSGLYSTIYLSTFITIRVLLKYFSFDTVAKIMALLCAALVIKFFIMFVSFCVIYGYGFALFRKIFLLESIYTLVLSPFIYQLLLKINKHNKETPYFFGSKKNVSQS
jgi:rod shape-determining protein MreD